MPPHQRISVDNTQTTPHTSRHLDADQAHATTAGPHRTAHRCSMAAKHRNLVLQEPRRSARLAGQGLTDYRASPTPSVGGRVVDPVYKLQEEPDFVPHRPRSVGLLTPRGRVTRDDTRPKLTDVAKVAPSGEYCGPTGQGPKMGTNQLAHLVDRSTDEADLKQIDHTFGVEEGDTNVDSRLNLAVMEHRMHTAMDNRFALVLPTVNDLSKLHKALTRKEIDDWNKDRQPHKNSAGFIHHEEVFPFTKRGYKYQYVPLLNWDDTIKIHHLKRDRKGNVIAEEDHKYPFTKKSGKPSLPPCRLPCSPYNATWKDNKILTYLMHKKGLALEDIVPPYALMQAALVLRIGEIMTRFGGDNDAPDAGGTAGADDDADTA